jgi:purine-binding chemotaxis protein CheW
VIDEQQVLRERARQLAEDPEPDSTTAYVEVLLCRARSERYALELRDLRSIHRPTGITAAPSAFPQVAGILNVRGELVPVLDFATLLGLGETPLESTTQVVLVESGHGRIGLLVDQVIGVDRIAEAELDHSVPGPSSSRGVAGGSTVLLSLDQLLAEQPFDDA